MVGLDKAHETILRSDPRNLRVLIVESDPDLQWKLARTLTVQGNRVVGTGSGDGALALLRKWDVDLILVAESLPGMRGLEVAQVISELAPAAPIILLADKDEERQTADRLAAIAACLVKPFRLETLRGVIESVIDSVQLAPAPAE